MGLRNRNLKWIQHKQSASKSFGGTLFVFGLFHFRKLWDAMCRSKYSYAAEYFAVLRHMA